MLLLESHLLFIVEDMVVVEEDMLSQEDLTGMVDFKDTLGNNIEIIYVDMAIMTLVVVSVQV